MVKRGEVWWLDLAAPIGSAPGFRRPGVAVSADSFNRSQLNTVTFVLLYSNPNLGRYRGNVRLDAADVGLDQESIANVTQLATVDRSQILGRIGAVPPSVMRQIDAGLRLALEL